MRVQKNTKRRSTADSSYFGNISKNSIKKDFKDSGLKKEIDEPIHEGTQRRILSLSETSSYYKYRFYIIGKMVKIKRDSDIGFNTFLCEFVYENDFRQCNP